MVLSADHFASEHYDDGVPGRTKAREWIFREAAQAQSNGVMVPVTPAHQWVCFAKLPSAEDHPPSLPVRRVYVAPGHARLLPVSHTDKAFGPQGVIAVALHPFAPFGPRASALKDPS